MMPMLESRMLLCFLAGLAGIQNERPAMEARQDGKKILEQTAAADEQRATLESARRWAAYALRGVRSGSTAFGVRENDRM